MFIQVSPMTFNERTNRYNRDPYVTLINTNNIVSVTPVNGDNCRIVLDKTTLIVSDPFSSIAEKLKGENKNVK